MIDFVTSDTHFGHARIIQHDNRPYKDVDEMDAALIDNWNAKVKNRNAHVWHLGDFAFRNKKRVEDYVDRLYGRIHIVFGNHDDKGARRHRDLFASCHESIYLCHKKQKITMYHYAQRTWRAAAHGSWHLFGHSHGRLPPYGKSFDVGVTPNKYTPLSFEEVCAIMATLPPAVSDRELREEHAGYSEVGEDPGDVGAVLDSRADGIAESDPVSG